MIMDLIEHGSETRTPVDPQRFNDTDLMEREASYGRTGFALQFMLDTTLSDAEKYPLKLSDLIVMSLDPEMAPVKLAWSSGPDYVVSDAPNVGMAGDKFHRPMWVANDMAQYTGTFMFIDPSGRGKDETSYAVVKMLHGYLFVMDVGGFISGGYSEETLKALAVIASKYKVNEIWTEPNFGDGMFNELFKPWLRKIHPCTLDEGPRATQQKERRIIDVLEPVMNQHRLVIDERLIKKDYESAPNPKYSLFYQMTRLTADKGSLAHDDRLDALAGAVAYWVEQMAQDADMAAEAHREKLLNQELAKFRQNVFGWSDNSTDDIWMDA